MEKWALVLIAFAVSQCLGDSTRLCCHDEKSWLASSRVILNYKEKVFLTLSTLCERPAHLDFVQWTDKTFHTTPFSIKCLRLLDLSYHQVNEKKCLPSMESMFGKGKKHMSP